MNDLGRMDEFELLGASWKKKFEQYDAEKRPPVRRLDFVKYMFFLAWEQGLLLDQHLPSDFDETWDFLG